MIKSEPTSDNYVFKNLIIEPYVCSLILFDKLEVAETITKILLCELESH